MTEQSWIWGGIATGDASLAPYAKAAFNRWFLAAIGNDNQSSVYILPGYLDDLLIQPTEDETVSTLTVQAGAAAIYNYIYVTDEVQYFPIQQLSTSNYRYDSLVLRLTRDAAPRVTLVLVNGDESSTYPPTPYTVEQDATGTWEVEIARVLIDSSVYELDGTKVEVYTRYMPVAPHYTTAYNTRFNSENLALTFLVGNTLAEGWGTTIGGNVPSVASKLVPQSRGQAVRLQNSTGIGYRDDFDFNGALNNRVTIQGTLSHRTAGTRTSVKVEYFRQQYNRSTVKEQDEFGFNTLDVHHFTRTFEVPDDTQFMRLSVTGNAVDSDFDVGQIIVAAGYFTGSQRPFHEYVPLQSAITDTSWDGDAKSTATVAIDLSADFGGIVPQHVKALVLQVRCRDSGSAGANPRINILAHTSAWQYGGILLDGLPNNYWRTKQIIVYINEPFQQSLSAVRGFRVQTVTSGGGTMDVYVEIVGFIV